MNEYSTWDWMMRFQQECVELRHHILRGQELSPEEKAVAMAVLRDLEATTLTPLLERAQKRYQGAD